MRDTAEAEPSGPAGPKVEGVRVEEPAAGEPKEKGDGADDGDRREEDQTEQEARAKADKTDSAGGQSPTVTRRAPNVGR